MNHLLTKLIELGFNVIPVNENKIPAIPWTKYQVDKVHSLNDFNINTEHWGLITGFNDVEAIDVDTKVIVDKKEREDFKSELISTLSDNIDNFEQKIVMVQTRSGGLHLIYQAGNIQGNQKLAKVIFKEIKNSLN